MKSEKTRNNIIVFGSVLLIVCMLIGYALPDKEVSVSERRHLAKPPKFSVSAITSGTYMTDMETYLSDQIMGREFFRKLYTFANQYLFFKTEVNGYVQKEDAIYRLEEVLSTEYVSRNAKYLDNIREKYFASNPCYCVLIPDKNYYLDKPIGYQRFDYQKEKELLTSNLKCQYIDIEDCLTLKDYYRTDLHWRQERLAKVTDRILQGLGNQQGLDSEYEQVTASGQFAGSYLLPSGFQVKPDTLLYVWNDVIEKADVFDYEKQNRIPVYTTERIGAGDDYDVFLGGAKALLTITNEQCPTNKELIIFRDSYTSSLAPLLIESYRKITLIDLRYTKPDYALEQISWNEDTQVLFLYQTMTLNANVFR